MAETAKGVLDSLLGRVNLRIAEWNLWAKKLAAAYSEAYGDVKRLLERVKAAKTLREQQSQERLSFMLSLLTVGLAGPIAKGFTVGFETSKTALKDKVIHEWLSDGISEVAKRGAEGLQELGLQAVTGSGVSESDPFVPPGPEPLDYYFKLTIPVEERTIAVGRVVESASLMSGAWTVEAARAFSSKIERGPFFRPPAIPSHVVLKSRAKLALLIGWGLARDERYWKSHNSRQNPEVFDFAPLRQELLGMRVPAHVVTLPPEPPPTSPFGAMTTLMVSMGQQQPPMNMLGFMAYCKGGAALPQLYLNLDTNKDGVAAATRGFMKQL